MTTPDTVTIESRKRRAAKIPPLENGDQLTRAEFERRYEAMPRVKVAELIEGVVYMGSPVHVSHGKPHADIMTWLGTYCVATPTVGYGDNVTVRLDIENEFQPDAYLRLDMAHGGRSRISEDDYIEGAPELVVEIAASSVSIDLREKLRAYRRNQVQEYIVWRVYDEQLDWFRWREGEYARVTTDANGIFRSDLFPGLQLDVNALLNGNMGKVLSVLQQGLASAEHSAFVNQLAAKA